MRDEFPDAVTLDQIRAALDALHIPVPVEDLQAIHIEIDGITIEHVRTDNRGRILAVGANLSTVTTRIGIDTQDKG